MSARIITVYSTKGGVGKTTTAVNLAWLAAADGNRTLLWDLDPQAGATWLLDVRQKVRGGAEAIIVGDKSIAKAIRSSSIAGLDVLPGDGTYRDLDITLDGAKKSSSRVARALKPLRDDYDVIVLDCPPGSSLVAENAVRTADVVVSPLSPALLSLRAHDQVGAFVEESAPGTPVIAFLNLVDRRKKSHREAADALPGRTRAISDIVVPASVVVERMAERHAALGDYAPGSPAGRAYAALWHAVAHAPRARR
ncbi:ParA family protein [Microbacterium sp. ZXX196]|uniref:ParA family protein n=1 Tax=Microbacterium sp. ZXX196 TaxID=2609291 RepID=UPI0012B7457E|nr:ParA family protein [Microbacterium sp. ZXX196]MTE24626.1 AAA family ATPase [Microbacterium sp. ZXX196]